VVVEMWQPMHGGMATCCQVIIDEVQHGHGDSPLHAEPQIVCLAHFIPAGVHSHNILQGEQVTRAAAVNMDNLHAVFGSDCHEAYLTRSMTWC
jgi:hypothetical protein